MKIETPRDREQRRVLHQEKAAQRQAEAEREQKEAAEIQRQWDDGFLNLVREPRVQAAPCGAAVTTNVPTDTEVTVSVRPKKAKATDRDFTSGFINGFGVGAVFALIVVMLLLKTLGVW